ncbi:MAG: acetate--CoA ligase [Acidobacteriaceae bacterium]|nr:acetate--CoA ligase [Acidobacteriaceae bacterium]MBV9502472.1 acetate--CoA ligase [Acidobacteriaceae bacterium]
MSTQAVGNEGIEQLLRAEADLHAPASLVAQARLQDYEAEYRRSVEDPEGFWAEIAQELEWFQPWQKVFDWNYPLFEWFQGATCNITHNCLDRQVKAGRKNKVAYIWTTEDGTERQITYGQLLDFVSRTANALRSIGVSKGDRVIIYMPVMLEGIVCMLACARIGAVHSVVYAGFSVQALRSRIEDAQARVILTADVSYRRGKRVGLRSIVQEAISGLEAIDQVVVLRRAQPALELDLHETDFYELVNKQSADCPAAIMDAEDPLYILYTSGTTGKPKGVVHVHGGYMVGIYYHMTRFWDIRDDDVFLCTSDIGWAVGHSYIVYAPLLAGATTLFREGAIDFPHPAIVWELIERYRASVIFTAPTAVRMFMRYGDQLPQGYNLRSIRLFTCAGEPLNPEAMLWAHRVLCGNGQWGFVADNWWQTETGGPCLGTLPVFAARPSKAGKALPGVVAEVVDAQGNKLPPNKGGLLVLRRPFPHMYRAVYGDPDRYAEDWRKIPNAYSTGDVAICDDDGYFTVVGRADDVLNVAGHRIGTADVEGALVSHPAVAEAAAIGRPDEIKGENIKAFVMLRVGHTASPELELKLKEHVRNVLGAIAVPAEIGFPEKLPKTRSGKIMRRLLKAQELGKEIGDVSTLEE